MNLEATVLRLVRPPVREDHHARDRERAVKRRDVEALDAHGRGVKRERALKLEQRLVGAVVGIARPHHVARERVVRVVAGHVEQMPLLASLGTVEVTGAPSLLGEPLPHHLGVGQVDREVDLGGDVGRLVVVALDEAADELLLGDVEPLVEDELDRAHRAALAHDEDAGGRDGLLAIDADEVHVDLGGERDLLPVVERGETLESLLESSRPLEVEVGGGSAHLVLDLAHDLGALPGEEALHLTDVGGVLDGVDGAHAGPGTPAHVVVEAGTSPAREHDVRDGRLVGVAVELAAAALPLGAGRDADGHDLAQRVDGLAGGAGVGVGTEVAGALAVVLAGVLDGGEDVVLGDGDEGVALVVLEVDVEVGVVLGDEVALEHERLVLGPDHEVVEVADDLHHEGDLLAVVLERDVLAQAGAEVLGLAHVDDLVVRVLPEVAAGVGRHLVHAAAKLGQSALEGTDVTEVGHVSGVADGHLGGPRTRCPSAWDRSGRTSAPGSSR